MPYSLFKKSVLFFVLLLLFSCNQETKSPKTDPSPKITTKVDNSKRNTVQPSPKPSKNKIPPFKQLKRIGNQLARYNTEFINKKNLFKTPKPVIINEKNITLSGWAVDATNSKVAGGVYVQIGNKTFPAIYGKKRPDVVKALGGKQYLKSGFHIVIPTNKIGKGIHNVTINVLSNDKTSYYKPRDKKLLKIKVN